MGSLGRMNISLCWRTTATLKKLFFLGFPLIEQSFILNVGHTQKSKQGYLETLMALPQQHKGSSVCLSILSKGKWITNNICTCIKYQPWCGLGNEGYTTCGKPYIIHFIFILKTTKVMLLQIQAAQSEPMYN